MQNGFSDEQMTIGRQEPIHETSAIDSRRSRYKEDNKRKKKPSVKAKDDPGMPRQQSEVVELYDGKERKLGMGSETGRRIDLQA